MDIAALTAAVISETGKPHQSALIERAVKSVILKAHQSDYYQRDLTSDDNVVPGSPAIAVVEELPTRFRKFESIELLDASTGVSLGKYFDPVLPSSSLQYDGNLIPYHYWVEGANVKLFSEISIDRLGWSWYQNPDLSTTAKTTWITANYEQDIIDGASAYVYLKAGDKSSASIYADFFNGFIRRLRAENLLVQI